MASSEAVTQGGESEQHVAELAGTLERRERLAELCDGPLPCAAIEGASRNSTSALARWHQAQFGMPATARRKALLAQAAPRPPAAPDRGGAA